MRLSKKERLIRRRLRRKMAGCQHKKKRSFKIRSNRKKVLGDSLFDIEHGLILYARSYCTFPAQAIYDKELLKKYEDVIKTCHIYFIGYLPKIELLSVDQVGEKVNLNYNIAQEFQQLCLPIPEGCKLVAGEKSYYAESQQGERFSIPQEAINEFLREHMAFDVRYIGQAYGKKGSRNALDRLIKHETLQKISLTDPQQDKELSILLLEVEPSTKLVTAMNPNAKSKDEDGSRIRAGIDKLFNTTEAEMISLFEASMIRYFNPQFNNDFKNSFPSTRLKVLGDCYAKDFSSVSSEINFDDLPFQLCSDAVSVKNTHFVNNDLHKDKDRKAFFYGK